MTEDEWLEEFSDNLAYLLRENDITQKQLAEKTGLSIKTINSYINGTRKPGIKAIINISYALDCELISLIDFDDMID